MEQLHNILQVVIIAITVILSLFAYRSLPRKSATLLTLALVGIGQYVIEYLPEGRIYTWLHHIPVYVGLVLLFIFIDSYATPTNTPSSPITSIVPVGIPVLTTLSGAALVDWLRLMTDEGLQHILVMPLFASLWVASLLRSVKSESEGIASSLNWFIGAGAFIALIHVMEFFVESQGLIPALTGERIENLELILFALALMCFGIGIRATVSRRSINTSHA